MTGYSGTLTAAQITYIQQIADRWTEIGLSTDRCDRAAAEAAVRSAYRAAGVDEPRLVIWMDSPLGGVLAAESTRQLGGQLRDQLVSELGGGLGDQLWGKLGVQLLGELRDQLWGKLGVQLLGQLRGELRGDLGVQLRNQLRGELCQLRGQLRDHTGDQLWGQLIIQLGGKLRDQLWDELGSELGVQLSTQLPRGKLRDQLGWDMSCWWDAYWLALHQAALPIAGLPPSPRLTALAAASEQTGWWWPQHGAVILTDRPTIIRRDPQARLHNGDGPALAYADGYAGWWWHGTPVPRDLVEGDGWDAARILKHDNAEQRRCAIERLGWDRFIADAELAPVGAPVADPGNPGQTLTLYDIPARLLDAPVRVLLCANATPGRDGTTHRFGLTVPVGTTDPVAAAAWTFDVDPDAYRTLARAT